MPWCRGLGYRLHLQSRKLELRVVRSNPARVYIVFKKYASHYWILANLHLRENVFSVVKLVQFKPFQLKPFKTISHAKWRSARVAKVPCAWCHAPTACGWCQGLYPNARSPFLDTTATVVWGDGFDVSLSSPLTSSLYRTQCRPRQGCQIFLGTTYQNGEKCTKWP
jgi:hypothetical protein